MVVNRQIETALAPSEPKIEWQRPELIDLGLSTDVAAIGGSFADASLGSNSVPS